MGPVLRGRRVERLSFHACPEANGCETSEDDRAPVVGGKDPSALSAEQSEDRGIKKKVQNTDVQNTVIVIPTLADIMTHNNLREGISGKRERSVLSK